MAGEIRDKMAALRKAKEAMIADLGAEIDGVMREVEATRADGLEAMKLPRAALAAHRQEIQEIRDEFAVLSNGGPPGPLSGTQETSQEPSGASGDARGPNEGLTLEAQPQAGWKG